jgi:hypothetical protein
MDGMPGSQRAQMNNLRPQRLCGSRLFMAWVTGVGSVLALGFLAGELLGIS